MNYCKICTDPAGGNYCSNCGQPAELKRINGQYIVNEIQQVINFEKGFLYTFKELPRNPGKAVRQFITENRNRLIKPIIFIIITSLIYTLVNDFFQVEKAYTTAENQHTKTVNLMNQWIQENYGYSNLILGIFIAIWIKLLFRKYHFNFFEILILLCFVMGMGMLIFAFFGLLGGIIHINLLLPASVIAILYCSWAIGQFFDKKKTVNYLKAFVSYILGMLTFSILVTIFGTFIDLIKK